MKIDSVSTKLIQLALYLDQIKPGLVSEIWLDPSLVDDLKSSLPDKNDIPNHVKSLEDEIHSLSDARRKEYLVQMLRSLRYQLDFLDEENINLTEFTENCFGIKIPRCTKEEIDVQEKRIQQLEREVKKSREVVLNENNVPNSDVEKLFISNLDQAKKLFSDAMNLEINSQKNDFSLKLVSNKPWGAFNKHTRPFESELILNLDHPLNNRDIRYLAFHEGFGGHHSELSLKDRLLANEDRGEHGLVVTYSPQTFVSEAIAVNSQDYFDTKKMSDEILLIAEYQKLSGGMLLNTVSYMFFQDRCSHLEIEEYLNTVNITENSKKFISNFATDEIYGIYTLVYYHAGEFLKQVYDQSMDKQRLLKEIYTQPTTPSLLKREQKS